MLPSGLPKFAWLNRLKISAAELEPRVADREALGEGEVDALRARAARRYCGRRCPACRRPAPCRRLCRTTASACRSSSWPLSLSRPGAKLTRCGTNEPHWQTFVDVTVNGNPLANRATPCTCQPPRM